MSDRVSDSWNRFNSDFTFPESGDAARVAHEVKASIDTWVQNSLSRMESDMRQRAQINLAQMREKLAQSKNELQSVQMKIVQLQAALDQLAPGAPNLQAAVDEVKKKAADARSAMEAAAQQWEKYGSEAVATTMKLAETVATFV
ncbi:MAG TPA: hypothetical protein VL361_23105 [Candidatus Limnocylindrales bacterium]|jgi:uncharacterized phage infection (PIP) family protein YhgE|nr:hypothetical protein [Candidatus Limnocylindrales bacterium]